MKRIIALLVTLLLSTHVAPGLQAQSVEELHKQIESLDEKIGEMEHNFNVMEKLIDDVLWIQKPEDVNVLEVEHLIQALKAEDNKFEYEIFQDLLRGYSFNRMDRETANEIRVKIYKFLATHLDPPNPIRDVASLKNAAYRY